MKMYDGESGIWTKEISGYQVDEVAAASRFASLGVRPYKETSVSFIQVLC